jgi:hypothetical protein
VVNLIIQIKGNKNTRYNNEKFSLLSKSSGLIPLASNLVLALAILGFMGKHPAPLAGQLGLEMAGWIFSFFFPLLSLFLWGFCYKWKL